VGAAPFKHSRCGLMGRLCNSLPELTVERLELNPTNTNANHHLLYRLLTVSGAAQLSLTSRACCACCACVSVCVSLRSPWCAVCCARCVLCAPPRPHFLYPTHRIPHMGTPRDRPFLSRSALIVSRRLPLCAAQRTPLSVRPPSPTRSASRSASPSSVQRLQSGLCGGWAPPFVNFWRRWWSRAALIYSVAV